MTTLAPRITALFIAALAMSSVAIGNTIHGVIEFAGQVTMNTTSLATATKVTAWKSTRIIESTGDFATYASINDPVAFTAPWFFNSGPVSNFWSVDGFQFALTSSSIDYQSKTFLFVSGTGTISGHGFTPTPGSWSFSTQSPSIGSKFSFSASGANLVPDGGDTAVFLGSVLIGLYAFVARRKNTAK